MATVTIRAADSAQALEEVMRCLGPDALILSTRQNRGQVEIVAAPAGGRQVPPSGLADPPPSLGFAGHLLRQLVQTPVQTGVLPPNLPRRVILIGPPGAGRSTLAARLAAESLRTAGAARPRLVAPRPDLLAPPGRLSAHARLLGLVPHRPVWRAQDPIRLESPAADETQIVDLSDLAQVNSDLLSSLCVQTESALWLVVPTGLHPDLLDQLCAQNAGLVHHVVLTRTDLCPPRQDDFDRIRGHGLAVSLTTGGTGLLDALSAHGMMHPCPEPAQSDLKPLSEEQSDAATRLS
jgi:hypothetical protein